MTTRLIFGTALSVVRKSNITLFLPCQNPPRKHEKYFGANGWSWRVVFHLVVKAVNIARNLFLSSFGGHVLPIQKNPSNRYIKKPTIFPS